MTVEILKNIRYSKKKEFVFGSYLQKIFKITKDLYVNICKLERKNL